MAHCASTTLAAPWDHKIKLSSFGTQAAMGGICFSPDSIGAIRYNSLFFWGRGCFLCIYRFILIKALSTQLEETAGFSLGLEDL